MRKIIKKVMSPALVEAYRHFGRKKIMHETERLKCLTYEEKQAYLNSLHKVSVGFDIDWENPLSYTEKAQLEKLNGVDSLKTMLTDKYLVREWVKNQLGTEEYLIPLLGVWDRFSDIDFDSLPTRFVLKTNHGSGTNLIIHDKNKLNKLAAKMMFNDWMQMDYGYVSGLELHYSGIQRKIICEKYIENKGGDLYDYKFICFHGKPYYVWVDTDRFTNHTRYTYDMNWHLQDWQFGYPINKEGIEKPENFDQMVDIVKILCKGFEHVRVDLYNVNGKIYFGEMTFTSGSGLEPIDKDANIMLGSLWGGVIFKNQNCSKSYEYHCANQSSIMQAA